MRGHHQSGLRGTEFDSRWRIAQLTTFDDNDALNLEVLDFIRAIRTGERPLVNGEDGRRALETAIAITTQIKANL